MSGGLEIRSGGVIAVDTAELRHAAARLTSLAADGDRVHASLIGVAHLLELHGIVASVPCVLAAETAGRSAALAADLRALALVYEMVELEAERAAAEAGGDPARAARLGRALAVLQAEAGDAGTEARRLLDDRRGDAHAELERQIAQALQPFGPPGWGAAIALPLLLARVRTLGRGLVPRNARLRGDPQPVTVPVLRRGSTAAPRALADIAGRMPGHGDSRIRVERYVMPDGSREFAAYIAGTQSALSVSEPFDMSSNLALYDGVRAASYDAAVAALRASGARDGDVVHLAGHSQGGMIAERLALDAQFRVATVVSFGSPVQADVRADTLQITLRHTDDPVAALAAGGAPQGAGAPGSFVAERIVHLTGSVSDLAFGAHQLDAYAETARLVDASADPRVDAVREHLAQLGTATSVAVTVYGAERGWVRAPGRADVTSSSAADAG
ncbi:hypothetical protein [uncultured Microbacterium sp.]|uniref:Uncharacterized protein n=1 Tax=uncultured Microbacterium sp. TaxID=191216 RepID=A0A1Y5P200_9MICO|nr:hypothetical protein [uncultured Microbacterium sp.]SBS72695.1 conserved hypothetical protein [uncultured Microbacterium sp.]